MSFTISYSVFLIILIISSIQYALDEQYNLKLSVAYEKYFKNYTHYINNKELTYRFPARDMYIRRDAPSYIDITVCIWIVGLCFREIKKIYNYGLREYLSSWNNILITIMHVLLLCSYALKFFSIITIRIQKAKLDDQSFWDLVNGLHKDTEEEKMVYQTFYWLNEGKKIFFNLFNNLFIQVKNRSILLVCIGSYESF